MVFHNQSFLITVTMIMKEPLSKHTEDYLAQKTSI